MKHRIERRKPIQVFFPLQRVLRGESVEGNIFRIVEGHAFVNEWVGDGVNLKRSAMMAASADYSDWGVIREMHQPSAVGTAVGSVEVDRGDGTMETLPLGISWDERGAFLRSKIVDPSAILKLDEGVYRGYSVGIRATVMRGNNVEACEWIENSLVDRPADKDAKLTAIRFDDAQAEADVIRYFDGPMTFGQIAEDVREADIYDDLRGAFYAFLDCTWTILEAGGDAALLNQNLDEFTAYVKSEIFPEAAASDMEERAAKVRKALDTMKSAGDALEALPATTNRAATAENDLTTTRAALETAKADLNTVRADLATAKETIKKLEKLPDPNQPRPVKFGAERAFTLNNGDANDLETRQAEVKTQVDRLLSEAQKPETSDARRTEISTEITRLQQGSTRK